MYSRMDLYVHTYTHHMHTYTYPPLGCLGADNSEPAGTFQGR